MNAILFHRIGPYHEARIRAAARQLPLMAIQGCSKDATYAWDEIEPQVGCPVRTLVADRDSEELSGREIFSRLREVIDWSGIECLFVPGWSGPLAMAAIRLCIEHNIPMVMMSESNAWDEPRVGWREAVKSRLVKMTSAALVGGTSHRDYIAKLGMPVEHVALGYDTVDNGYFDCAGEAGRDDAAELRARLSLPARYFLASARFIAKKNLQVLLEAFAAYRNASNGEPSDLVLLGDGELRGAVKQAVAELGISDCVHLPGFKQYAELPSYYALAEAFVHASTTEQWGLVVNEAMACGLPVIISARCGCARDLVSDGVNGWVFDPLNVADLAARLIEFDTLSDSARAAMGAASAQIIAAWGPERFADGLVAAAKMALKTGPRSPSMGDRLLLHVLAMR